MTGLDLSTREGALRFAELRRAEMRNLFEARGCYECNGYSMGGYIFATYDIAPAKDVAAPSFGDDPDSYYRTGERLPKVEAQLVRIPTFIRGVLPAKDYSKLFSSLMRSCAKKQRAIGSLVMSESWALNDEKRKTVVGDESWENVPGRREQLFMALEHAAAGSHIWIAEIKREPTLLAEWRKVPTDEIRGRLGGLSDFRS